MKKILFILLAINIILNANDGTLDLSFGTNGVVTTTLGGNDEAAFIVAIQPDNKILAAGFSNAVAALNYDFALVRYNSNGSIDTTFGTNGFVSTNFGGDDEAINAIIVQPDGKIVAGGYTNAGGNYNFALARYNSNGSLDISFGNNGLVITDLGGNGFLGERVFSFIRQPDGKIIAVGVTNVLGATDFALVRYNTNGSIDTTFGNNGIATANAGGDDEGAFSVVLQPDGKIVTGGYSNASGNYDFVVIRFNNNGSVDTSFGTDGIAITSLDNLNDTGRSVVLQPDGKIVLAGYIDTEFDIGIVRYTTNGSLDTSFGISGIVITDLGGTIDAVYSVVIQPDGKIVVAGVSNRSGANQFAVLRYLVPSLTISTLSRDIRAKYGLIPNLEI